MATLRTAGDVDTPPLLHPLRHVFGCGNRWVGRLPQGLATPPQGLGFASIGQKAAVTNSHKARGQNMQQKALDKGVCRQLGVCAELMLLANYK